MISSYDDIIERVVTTPIMTKAHEKSMVIPSTFKSGLKYKRTGKAGIFAGSLELVKEGNLTIKQDNLFDEIYVKEIK